MTSALRYIQAQNVGSACYIQTKFVVWLEKIFNIFTGVREVSENIFYVSVL